MDIEDGAPPPVKRTDVGYKRPPVEHQFKAGQKPPPRKKHPQKPESMTQCLARILREERRVKSGKRVVWRTNASLLVEVAFQMAEKGNGAVSRAITSTSMAGDKPEVVSDETRIECDPDGVTGVFHYTVLKRL